MRFLQRSRVGVILVAFLPLACWAADPEAPEMSAALAWFETLGFPSIKDCPYVRVATGYADPNVRPPRNSFCDGFLLSDDGKKFTVFFTESIRRGRGFYGDRFSSMTFVRTPKNTLESERVGYEPISLKEEARKAIEAWRSSTERESRDYGNYLCDQVSAFVLTWSCLHKGLGPEAHDAFAEAQKFHALGLPRDGTFREILENHLVYILADRAVFDFVDPASRPRPRIGVEKPIVFRTELLTIFKKLSKDFQRSILAKRIDEITGVLRVMAREDAEHHSKPLDEMTQNEQIAEWIFRLRDQPGWSWSRPGFCEVLSEFRGRSPESQNSPKYPADHLLEFGFSAVPQLIDSLDDTRLSRAVDEGRLVIFHNILTVGECARQILGRIAHRSFDYRPTDGSSVSDSDARRETREMIRGWWAEVRDKGADALLLEGVRKGNWDSMTQARILLKAHPDRAPEAIITGIQHAEQEIVRNDLVRLLSQAKDETSAAFLRKEMVDDARPRKTRILAAEALYWRGDERALPVLIAEWEKGISGSAASTLEARQDLEDLADCLLASGKPAAVKSVTSNFSKCPIFGKIEVIDTIRFGRFSTSSRHDLSKPEAEASDSLLDEMLVAALDDDSRAEGFGINSDKFIVQNPRVCDMAAWKLSERWPDKCTFNWMVPPDALDLQIATIRTVWRGSGNN